MDKIPNGKTFYKVPTAFVRDFDNDPSKVTDKIHPDALWVFEGQGYPTLKTDGTCCWIDEQKKLFRRLDVKKSTKWKKGKKVEIQRKTPDNFILVQEDPVTGHKWGWIPVDPGNPADKYHWEAFQRKKPEEWKSGTYELLGPKIQCNLEKLDKHVLDPHGLRPPPGKVPLTFDELKIYFEKHPYIEGIVWYLPEKDTIKMAKLKGIDFGVKRVPRPDSLL